jgi:hypothetical protein
LWVRAGLRSVHTGSDHPDLRGSAANDGDMSTTTGGRSAGIAGVALLGFLLGALTFAGAVGRLAAAGGTVVDTVAAVGLLVASLLLMPAAVLLVRRDRRGQYLGVVGFAGIAVLDVLPAVAGGRSGVSVLGVGTAVFCALYLSLASEEFDAATDGPAVPEDDEEGVEGNPLR